MIYELLKKMEPIKKDWFKNEADIFFICREDMEEYSDEYYLVQFVPMFKVSYIFPAARI